MNQDLIAKAKDNTIRTSPLKLANIVRSIVNKKVDNAANQLNAQNLLNLSNYALSSLWQSWRDEAAWVNSSSENAENRAHNTAIAALERSTELDLADENKTSALYQLLGKFGIALVTS